MIDVPICLACEHLHDDSISSKKLKCKAFPRGIPDEIIANEKKHNEVLRGQVGDFIFDELIS